MTPQPERTRYGQLMGDAARHIADATVILSFERIADASQARAAVGSYRRLLAAIHAHAWQLAGGSRRTAGITASTSPQRGDVAVVAFIDSLAPTTTRASDPALQQRQAPVGRAWELAARSVRAATDLLATHRDASGEWRSPEAALLDDPAIRGAGLVAVADLTLALVAAQRDLGLRCGQAGVPRREVARTVPDLGSVATTARDITHASAVSDRATGHAGDALAELTVARPGIRLGDPLVELGDRIHRLRAVAWQLTREPHVGVATLVDYAAAGIIVHAHLAANAAAGTPGVPPHLLPSHSVAGRAARARDAWGLIHRDLRAFRTPTPGLAVVRAELSPPRWCTSGPVMGVA